RRGPARQNAGNAGACHLRADAPRFLDSRGPPVADKRFVSSNRTIFYQEELYDPILVSPDEVHNACDQGERALHQYQPSDAGVRDARTANTALALSMTWPSTCSRHVAYSSRRPCLSMCTWASSQSPGRTGFRYSTDICTVTTDSPASWLM